jgi:hypothetical protein
VDYGRPLHNLILPAVNENIHAHHEGLAIGLIAYLILSFLMVFIYPIIWPGEKIAVIKGLKIGVFIGIVWVLPHGLALAGIHHTSILYELTNTLYHVFEQSIGGIVISLLIANKMGENEFKDSGVKTISSLMTKTYKRSGFKHCFCQICSF